MFILKQESQKEKVTSNLIRNIKNKRVEIVDLVFFNGQIMRMNEVNISFEDRGYQFGDGIYEVIRVYDGKPFTLKEHLDRLERSGREILLELKDMRKDIEESILTLIEKNNIRTGNVYIQITRGVAPRNHDFPDGDTKLQVIAYTNEVERPIQKQKTGITATLKEDIRWLRCDIKSLNLLGNVLAKQEAKMKGFQEAIQHRNGTVTEGSATNVFIVKNEQLFTHPLSNLILPGITRELIIKLSKQIGLPVIQEPFTVDQLLDADEIFISSTTNEVMPVIKVDDKIIGNGTPGKITKKLQDQYEKLVSEVIAKV